MRPAAMSVGPYRVGRRLALGGMGEVYVAVREDTQGARPLALKLLLPHLTDDPSLVTMFLDEARIAAQLAHPNIVQLFDVGKAGSRYYLAMELVNGVALSVFIRALTGSGRRLPASQVVFVARQLAEGLAHAHETKGLDKKPLDIIHRDISPQNVLVSRRGEVKLTDFGIARARNSLHETGARVLGKCEYLAPEQVTGAQLRGSVDQFSLAVTLVHLALGASPFRRGSIVDTMRAVCDDALPDLREARPDLPLAFVEALERATSKDPSHRFASLRGFLAALPEAPPDSARELGDWVTRLCGVELGRFESAQATGSLVGWTESLVSAEVVDAERYTEAGASTQGLATVASDGSETLLVQAEGGLHTRGLEPVARLGDGPRTLSRQAEGVLHTQSLEGLDAGALARVTAEARRRGVSRWALVLAVLAGIVVVARWRSEGPSRKEPTVGPAQAGSPTTKADPRAGSAARAAEQSRARPAVEPSALVGESTGTGAVKAATERRAESGGTGAVKAATERRAESGASGSAVRGGAPEPFDFRTSPAASLRFKRPLAARPPDKARRGLLSVDAEPWAEVFVHDRKIGDTPLASVPVPAGELIVRLRNPKTGRELARTVTVSPGREVFVREVFP